MKSIIFLLFLLAINSSFAQKSENVKMISETTDQVVVDLSPDEDTTDIDREIIDRLINSYYSVVGIKEVELTESGNIRITYIRSKLNGPGIFIGLAKEYDFHFAELIDQ